MCDFWPETQYMQRFHCQNQCSDFQCLCDLAADRKQLYKLEKVLHVQMGETCGCMCDSLKMSDS